jgi:hypothetical protein
LIPPVATRTFEPGMAKSTLSPLLIDKVIGVPEPPAVATCATTVPAGAAQSIVGFGGVNAIVSAGRIVTDSVALALPAGG